MRVLVTGGAGFLGSHVVYELVKRGYEVSIFTKPTTNLFRIRQFIEDKSVHVHYGDILNARSFEKAVKNRDYIIHTAALLYHNKRGLVYKVNYLGAVNVFRAAYKNNVKKVIHVSTAFVNFYKHGVIREDNGYNCLRNEYGISKMRSELVAKYYVKKGLDITIVRPTAIYGAGDTKGWTLFIKFAKKGLLVISIGNPKMKFNPIYVSDVAIGILKALEYGCSGESYILAGDEIIEWEKFIELAMNGKQPLLYIPEKTLREIVKSIRRSFLGTILMLPDEEMLKIFYKGFVYSNEKAKKELKWKPLIGLKWGIKLVEKWIEQGEIFRY